MQRNNTYTNGEKMDMLRIFIRSNDNPREASVRYLNSYPERRQPNPRIFSRLEANLRRIGCFNSQAHQRNQQNRIPEDEETIILAYFRAHPWSSIREAVGDLGYSYYKVFSILKRNKMKAYKIHLVQGLNDGDRERRLAFCNWLINHRHLINVTIWSDESNFTRNGISNRKNDHYWDDVNPRQLRPCRYQNRFSINVWLGVLNGYLLGPYFYEGTLNSERYGHFLQTELNNLLDDIPLAIRRDVWFQQDGAPPHNARNVRDILTQKFRNNWIANGGPVAWPARSPDLSILDFFIWGYLKQKVYSTTPENLNDLRNRISDTCRRITPYMLRRAQRNLVRRAQLCIANNGGHFEQSI